MLFGGRSYFVVGRRTASLPPPRSVGGSCAVEATVVRRRASVKPVLIFAPGRRRPRAGVGPRPPAWKGLPVAPSTCSRGVKGEPGCVSAGSRQTPGADATGLAEGLRRAEVVVAPWVGGRRAAAVISFS